ncbi:type II secretion system F family protein [Aestuariimicrobium sp. T2.26MG-19.2B]|uniref:type II secretion system F family protein n=1 Tax=Aestuariimicrobium sp. T2.26MG-19.2B TaxID=3040679 RepID=UPI0024776168|nr:pilus assembly protein TadB [Aestuariimicrobium sp. T2.26MG-19.2B]CAI9404760.1 hypothetical protein AESSP_01277 [Aestuariimicrobium sp. T2.26MG-19.2B]
MTWVVAGCLAMAAGLLVPGRPVGVSRLVERQPAAAMGMVRRLAAVIGAIAGVWGVGAVVGPEIALWLLVLGMSTGLGVWLVRRSRLRRLARVTRQQVAEACQVVAGQLTIGLLPQRALEAAAEDCDVVRPVLAAVRVGGSAPEALRRAGASAGAGGLVELAAAWELSTRLGAPAAALAQAVADGLAREERLRETVATELSAVRATSTMLAFLPVVGVLMAALVGADPAHFLLTTWPGRLCVLVATSLTAAGIVWTERLAERSGGGL